MKDHFADRAGLDITTRAAMPHTTQRAAVFAASFAALYAGHETADHWVQSAHQAGTKGQRTAEGRRACAAHVATLTATKSLTLWATSRATGLRLSAGRVFAALTFDAASHYWIDRRYTLRGLAKLIDPINGKAGFHDLGDDDAAPCGTGRYALDQAAHIAMLWTAALIIAGGRRGNGAQAGDRP